MSGCENHRAFVFDRGGRRVVGELTDTTLVRWGRVRDDISVSTIRLSNIGPKCKKVLAKTSPGRHEIVVFRGGVRVWEGPLTLRADGSSYVELQARDVLHYAYRTAMRKAYSNAYPNIAYVTERARKVITAEMARKEALDPPINVLQHLDVRTNADTAKTSRSTKAHQMTVWQDLDAMAARSGLDYTTIGRTIYIGDVHDSIGQTEVMTEADFLSEIVVTEYGMELATRVTVTDGQGRWGSVGGTDPFYGEWEILNTSYEEEVGSDDTPDRPSTVEMQQQARRNASGRYPAPIMVRVPANSTLAPTSHAFDVNTVVPGVRVPVRATLTARTVEQEQKLDSFTVEATPAGETISVTLGPAPGTGPEAWAGEGSDS